MHNGMAPATGIARGGVIGALLWLAIVAAWRWMT